MTPIWRPCRRTASALRFFASNFIFVVLLGLLLAAVSDIGVERAFLAFAMLAFTQVIADERLYDWDEGAGHHEEVAVKDANEIEDSVIARDDLPRLDSRDVGLWQAETAAQVPLAPAAADPGLLQVAAHVLRKALQAQRLDMLCDIFLHG